MRAEDCTVENSSLKETETDGCVIAAVRDTVGAGHPSSQSLGGERRTVFCGGSESIGTEFELQPVELLHPYRIYSVDSLAPNLPEYCDIGPDGFS